MAGEDAIVSQPAEGPSAPSRGLPTARDKLKTASTSGHSVCAQAEMTLFSQRKSRAPRAVEF